MKREDEQSKHFDLQSHRYSSEKILNPPIHVQAELKRIFQLLPKDKKQNIADFGSGTGRLTIPLLKAGYSVTAVDISQKSGKELIALALSLQLGKRLRFLTTLPSDTPCIVGTDILHHVDIPSQMKKFAAALPRGGVVVFSEPNGLHLAWYIFISLFLKWEIEKGVMKTTVFYISDCLRKAGFTRIETIGFGLIPPPFISWSRLLSAINYSLSNLPFVKLFAYRIIISAGKE